MELSLLTLFAHALLRRRPKKTGSFRANSVLESYRPVDVGDRERGQGRPAKQIGRGFERIALLPRTGDLHLTLGITELRDLQRCLLDDYERLFGGHIV